MPGAHILSPDAAVPVPNVCLVNPFLGIRVDCANRDNERNQSFAPRRIPVVFIQPLPHRRFKGQRVGHRLGFPV